MSKSTLSIPRSNVKRVIGRGRKLVVAVAMSGLALIAGVSVLTPQYVSADRPHGCDIQNWKNSPNSQRNAFTKTDIQGETSWAPGAMWSTCGKSHYVWINSGCYVTVGDVTYNSANQYGHWQLVPKTGTAFRRTILIGSCTGP